MLDRIKSTIVAGVQSTRRAWNHYRSDFRDEKGFYLLNDTFRLGNFQKSYGIEKGYNYNTIVFAIINRIAQLAADIPTEVIKKDSQNNIEVLTEGSFYDFVYKPNDNSDYKRFTYESMVYQLANGNSIENYIIPDGFNFPLERFVLAPQYIDIDCKEVFHGYEPTKYNYRFGKKDYEFTPDEILHVKRFNPDISDTYPCYGLSPLQAAFKTLTASNENLSSQASAIKNKGYGGFITSRNDRALSDTEKKWAEDAVKKRIGGGHKFNGVGVLSGNMDYFSIGMSPTDLKLLESGLMNTRDFCSVYGVSSKMFNDPSGSTFNNIKEDNKKMYNDGVLPPLEAYIDMFNKTYSPLFEEEEGGKVYLRLKKETIGPLQEDEAKTAVKQRSKMETLTKIIGGVPEEWSVEQAKEMISETLSIPLEETDRFFINANES